MITAIESLDRTSPTFKADLNTFFSHGLPQLAAEINSIISAGSFGTELLGFRNKIIGDFSVDQRRLTSVADDEYCCDRWYALTETGSVTAGQVINPEQGAPLAWKLTQPDTVAKRIGLATIIESKNIRAYRGKAMNLSMRVKPSFSGNVRYAILEHTGTADVVTSDVVNNWNSATFTAGNFFIAGLNIIKTGVVSPGANLYGEIDDHGIFGASLNNAILFVWSESSQIQGATLEMNRPQFEPGIISTQHEWRLDEAALCSRYLPAFNWSNGVLIGPAFAYTTGTVVVTVPFPTARVFPTGVTVSSGAHFTFVAETSVNSTVAVLGSASTSSATVNLTVSGAVPGHGGVAQFNNAAGKLLFTGCEL